MATLPDVEDGELHEMPHFGWGRTEGKSAPLNDEGQHDRQPKTWRDGRCDIDDHLTQSVHTGTLEVVDPEDTSDAGHEHR